MKIGIIGCGTIGNAIAERLAATQKLLFYDRHPEKMRQAAMKSQGACCEAPHDIIERADILILSVKPKDLFSVQTAFGKSMKPDQLLVSALAGTTINDLNKAFGNAPILRMMPNLAISCGMGIVGLSASSEMGEEQKKQIATVFSPLGLLKWLPESMMDALTSLTGSGPAFACVLIEAMIDASIAMGFPAAEGRDLVYEMLKGTLTLLQDSRQHPGELKWQVTSPNGTTIAGLRELEAHCTRSGIIEAFIAAYARAKNISEDE